MVAATLVENGETESKQEVVSYKHSERLPVPLIIITLGHVPKEQLVYMLGVQVVIFLILIIQTSKKDRKKKKRKVGTI